MMQHAYKVFTHDLRPPVQGGAPVWIGTLPHALPVVAVDASTEECAGGWNACAQPEDALRIAGLWPNGRPSRLFRVETDEDVVSRGDKLRASTWTITAEVSESDIAAHVLAMSKPFGTHAQVMADEQMAWRCALGRPEHDADIVEQSLALALNARGLDWQLKRFDDARDAWDAWDAWDARDARAAWAAWAAWDAWAARDALTVQYAARMGWIKHDPYLLTDGLRDAYEYGLAIALPTGPNELGWAMAAK